MKLWGTYYVLTSTLSPAKFLSFILKSGVLAGHEELLQVLFQLGNKCDMLKEQLSHLSMYCHTVSGIITKFLQTKNVAN